MKLWNRVFLMDPGRQGEATAALVAAHEAVNAASDHGFNLWETVVGLQGQYGASALVPDIEAFTSGALMHDDADIDQLERLGSAVNDLVDGRPEDSYWDVRHVLGDWSEAPAYATNVIHHAPLPQLGPLAAAAIGVAERLHEVVGGPVDDLLAGRAALAFDGRGGLLLEPRVASAPAPRSRWQRR